MVMSLVVVPDAVTGSGAEGEPGARLDCLFSELGVLLHRSRPDFRPVASEVVLEEGLIRPSVIQLHAPCRLLASPNDDAPPVIVGVLGGGWDVRSAQRFQAGAELPRLQGVCECLFAFPLPTDADRGCGWTPLLDDVAFVLLASYDR